MVRPRLICFILILITLLAYWPVWQNAFIAFDDSEYIAQNRIVQAGMTWAGVKWAFTTWHASNWHPLTWLSHMLDCQMFGPEEGAHHFVSVLFHTANSIFWFLIWFRMTGRLWPAAFVAALFAWHPLHVESVAWAAERKDVLSTFFGALAFLCYAHYSRDTAPKVRSPNKSPFRSRYYLLALTFFALSLLAKPMLVTLPCVLLLLDYWPLQRVIAIAVSSPNRSARPVGITRALLLEKLPFLLLAVASGVVTVFAQHSGQAVATLVQVPLGLRLANALIAYIRYLAKTFWPADLAVLYPIGEYMSAGWAVAAAIGLVFITVLVWLARRTAPYLLVGWLWFVGTLVPVIGLVQVGSQALADRYTYVPLIGIFVMIAYGGYDLAKRFSLKPTPVRIVGTLVLAGCVLATMRQVRLWRDSETLFAHAVAVTKNNGIAHLHLADALARKGKNDQALAEYHEALRYASGLSQVHNNLATHLKSRGRVEESLTYFENALRLEPNVAQYHSNLGDALVKLQRFDEGLAQFAEAARLEPSSPMPHFLMGRTEMRRGLSTKAIDHFQEALRLDANDVDSLTFLARMLAANENSAIRNGAKAVSLAEHANQTSGGTEPFVLDTLAIAYAETGQFDLAQMVATNAIALAQATHQTNMLAAMEDRLRLFQNRIPYRETNSAGQKPFP